MKRVLVLGATSAIAQATCRLLVSRGAALFLVARNQKNLEAVAADLRVRGAAQVEIAAADLDDLAAHSDLVARAEAALGGLDAAVLAHGVLGNQAEAQRDWAAAQAVFTTNLLSPISLLTHLANRFEAQKHGVLVVISSVAGDRGRQSNYVYGASKGGLNVFLQGLRNRLYKSNVAVVTVKPGFVDSPMTAHLPKNKLFASPEQVAQVIVRAAHRRRNQVYAPGFWGGIMLIIRAIPEGIFKRLSL